MLVGKSKYLLTWSIWSNNNNGRFDLLYFWFQEDYSRSLLCLSALLWTFPHVQWMLYIYICDLTSTIPLPAWYSCAEKMSHWDFLWSDGMLFSKPVRCDSVTANKIPLIDEAGRPESDGDPETCQTFRRVKIYQPPINFVVLGAGSKCCGCLAT